MTCEFSHPLRPIDWALIGKAVSFYVGKGFSYVEAPWAVSKKAIDYTLPEGALDIALSTEWNAVLVGSAEQSLLELRLEDSLPEGDLVAVSPCFRGEAYTSYAEVRQMTFMKVELFSTGTEDYLRLVSLAEEFFEHELHLPVERLHTEMGVDLFYANLEVGSYGTRTIALPDGKPFTWSYGTGLAEPRSSAANLMKTKILRQP